MRDPVETLLEQTAQAVEARRSLPESTYRLQFSAGFTFKEAEHITPYLADLGVTHFYASPYLKARPGSGHGYDIVDHSRLNPEIGTDEDYTAWIETLRRHDLRQILDVVPNHMGIVGNENGWWNDVLENGPASAYAGYFDIDWSAASRPELLGRVLLPVLGAAFGEVLESQQLKLELNSGAFFIRYFDHRFPVAPRTYERILAHRLDELSKRLPADDPALLEYQSIVTSVRHLPGKGETEPARLAEGQREKEVIKRRLFALVGESAAVRQFLDETVAEFNGKPGEPRSFDLMDALLDHQAYRLSFWRVAADEINYRRFFDINELAALSEEHEEVFEAAHALVLRFLAEGKLAGVRVDHVDGLYDPRQYLERLQEHYVLACAKHVFDAEQAYRNLDWETIKGPLRDRITDALGGRKGSADLPLYVVVEKILGGDEALPPEWPVFGTSGYDFLNHLNGLFIANVAKEFTRIYNDFTSNETPFNEVVYRSKRLVLQSSMSSELQMLAHQLDRLAQKHRWSRDFTLNSLRHVLREVIACFPVYRSYTSDDGVRETDRRYLTRAIRAARQRNPAVSNQLFHFVRDTLLLKPPQPETADPGYRAEQRRFAGKFQQVTSPVIAKGIEDTAFYVYNRLLPLNEVGGDADRFGVSPDSLHGIFTERQAKWPRSLSATATHDTKRGEDLRARLNVLSEVPSEWRAAIARWAEMNRPLKVEVEDLTAPDANEEYFLYQTLVGAWPLSAVGGQASGAESEVIPHDASSSGTADCCHLAPDFLKRIQDYMRKALHEAKVHSSWINPDPTYDDAVGQFVAAILDGEKNRPFLDDLRAFAGRVAHPGLFNSLAQALLKFTAPGVPDTYQGTELWDFSLVDPDNRRKVDFEKRARLLQDIKGRADGADLVGFARELTATKEDGRIKLYLTWRALHARRDHPGLFAEGDYLPLTFAGRMAEHAFGFARRRGERAALVVVPRLPAKLLAQSGQAPVGPEIWGDTELTLPETIRSSGWRNVFTGEQVSARDGTSFAVSRVLGHFPVALMLAE